MRWGFPHWDAKSKSNIKCLHDGQYGHSIEAFNLKHKKYIFDKILEITPHGAPLCPPPRHRN